MEKDGNFAATELPPFTAQDAFALTQRLISTAENPALHHVRNLRRARQWPTIGKGNQAFPRVAWPFVNVCLAHAAGAPAEGPENVRLFRALRARDFCFQAGRMQVLDRFLEEPKYLNEIPIFPTLGESLDHFAEIGANAGVDILPDRDTPMARLFCIRPPTAYYALPFQGAKQGGIRKPITKSATLTPDVFRIISETLRGAPASTGSIWQSAPSESAAPGRAAQSDQHRTKSDDTGVRDKTQDTAGERDTQPGGASDGRSGSLLQEGTTPS